MNESMVFDIFNNAISLILTASAPMMISAMLVGLIIAIFQATTQIQEQTLAFVPKIIVIFLVLLVAGPWIMTSISDFTKDLFMSMIEIMTTR